MPNVGPPRRMGGWQLHTLIARSISGSVWAGLDIQTGQTVAVKLFNRPPIAVAVPGTTTDHPWEFLSGLNHPGIVKILSHGCENGQHYAVMEFSTQGNLKNTLFPGQKQTIFHAVIWTRQILAALDHLHQQGYVHLDIKPENILLFPDDCVKICDFGLMRPIAAPASVPMGTPG
ncbi:MAG TPA: protein kinase, partial [Magnetococcales bacterium]|nr:protein kinase [Magnetococcales bacterium]